MIDRRHGGYPSDAKHVTSLDPSKVVGDGLFDENYVTSCRVRTGRLEIVSHFGPLFGKLGGKMSGPAGSFCLLISVVPIQNEINPG